MNTDTLMLPGADEVNARDDAFQDMAGEYGGDLREAYFGSAIVYNENTGETRLTNLLVTTASSYEEAVGQAYLLTRSKFKAKRGWTIRQLEMEDFIVWVADDTPPDFDKELDAK